MWFDDWRLFNGWRWSTFFVRSVSSFDRNDTRLSCCSDESVENKKFSGENGSEWNVLREVKGLGFELSTCDGVPLAFVRRTALTTKVLMSCQVLQRHLERQNAVFVTALASTMLLSVSIDPPPPSPVIPLPPYPLRS